jgi:hypothetical protein
MSQNSFISGIYNHCDRWCERCKFTDRCKIFFEDRKQFNALEDKEDYLSIVSQNLGNVIEMLQKMAEERGIDLEDLKDGEAYDKEKQKAKKTRNHPLALIALDYMQSVEKWFNTNDHLQACKENYLHNVDLGVNLEESDRALRLIDEASNIIHWYLFQIHIKLSSAVRYYPHDPNFEDELNNMHHSSAKIALIGIENSMKAWQSLSAYLKNEEDFILETLLKLQQLKTKIHQQFPLLYKYKRPFFDE